MYLRWTRNNSTYTILTMQLLEDWFLNINAKTLFFCLYNFYPIGITRSSFKLFTNLLTYPKVSNPKQHSSSEMIHTTQLLKTTVYFNFLTITRITITCTYVVWFISSFSTLSCHYCSLTYRINIHVLSLLATQYIIVNIIC